MSGGVAAHHSAVQFDFGNTVSVAGEVKRFRAMNPHMLLVLHVTDEKGSRDIEFEGTAPTTCTATAIAMA
jgi:hypothetical protein